MSIGVGLVPSFRGRVEALVHPSAAADDVLSTQHVLFLTIHLALAVLALCAIPVRLAIGVPGPIGLAALLLLQTPLLAVIVATQSGNLSAAHAMSTCGLAVFAGLLTLVAAQAGAPLVAVGLTLLGLTPLAGYIATTAWMRAMLNTLSHTRAERDAARHRALACAGDDLILCVDRRGAVVPSGEWAQTPFTLAARDLSGPGLFERLHVADRPAFLQAVSDALDARPAGPVGVRLRTAMVRSARGDFDEPVYSAVEVRLRGIGGGACDDALAICLIRDVTALRERETAAAAALHLAERAEVTRERLLANISHELRTPLNAIIGFADLLRLDTVPKDEARRTEYAEIIATSGQHLLSVVNSILDVSKLESGSLELEPARFDPAALLDRCIDIVRLKAEETGVTLVRQYDATLAPITADERACRQIVINLLSNAVKFTKRGGTVVLTARFDFGLSIMVEDTGIGIAEADMPRLGDAFFQASNARSRLFEGTGLGLSLVRGLVGLHGGSIGIESAPGVGTRVTVRLPSDCREPATVRAPVAIQTIPRRSSAAPVYQPKVKHVA